MRNAFLLLLLVSALSGRAFADSSPYLIGVEWKDCEHGLKRQPDGGPFSVYVFCDDALATNIGVINTEPAAGPGSIELTGSKTWIWYTYDRFWQDRTWAADVTSIAWSPSLKYLYVATQEIYGDGGIFQLDLVRRTFKKVVPHPEAAYYKKIKGGYRTRIIDVDIESMTLTFEISFFDRDKKAPVTKVDKIPLD